MNLKLYSILSHLVFFSLPIVATFKGKGTVVLVFILLLMHMKTLWINGYALKQKWKILLKTPLGFFAIGFILWMLLSAFWAPHTIKALFNAVRYTVLVGSGFLLYLSVELETETKKQTLLKAFQKGFLFYIAFFLSEIYIFPLASRLYTDALYMDKLLFIKGIVNLGFLFWPFLLLCLKHYPSQGFRKISFISFGILSLILFKASPDAARIGIILSTCGAFIVHRRPKIAHVAAAFFTLFALTAPWVMKHELLSTKLGECYYYLPSSYQHRVQIWEAMSQEALKKPIFGHGFDHSTTLSNGKIFESKKITPYFDASSKTVQTTISPFSTTIFSSHPHNGIIQIWAELGIVGIILFLGILWALTMRIAHIENTRKRACSFGLLLFYEVIHLVGHGLWQKWICATIILSILGFYLSEHQKKS